MKKTILVAVTLILLVATTTGFLLSKVTENMQIRINAKDLPEDGLMIVKPSDADFDGLAAIYLQGMTSDEIERVKPLSVFIKNTGDRIVVAYAIVWEGTEANGKKTSYQKFLANSEALTDREDYFSALSRTNLNNIIEPGKAKLFSLLPLPLGARSRAGGGGSGVQSEKERNEIEQIEQESLQDNIQYLSSQLLEKYRQLTVSIDGVFFEDGTFVGSDSTGFFNRMKAQVDAKRDLRRSVSEKLKLGKSKDEIFKDIEAKANAKIVATNLSKDSKPADYYDFFSKLFAAQFLQMRKVYGDDNALDKALGRRNQPEPALRKVK